MITELNKEARQWCFTVGWHLLNPDTWEYINIWTRERGVVTVDSLNAAIAAKNALKPPEVVRVKKFR